MVSPTNTGPESFTSVQPRLAMVFWLTSDTDMPVTSDRVRQEFTSTCPNSVLAPYSLSKCSGCWFMVSSVNQVLSLSVMVLPGRCS